MSRLRFVFLTLLLLSIVAGVVWLTSAQTENKAALKVDGGYRRRGALELWIVPRGEHPPIPTPNSFPPKRKRGK